MKLKGSWRYDKNHAIYSIAEAIEASCDTSGHEYGALEGAAAKTDSTLRLLGQLVEMLHTNRTLSNQQVLELTRGFEEETAP